MRPGSGALLALFIAVSLGGPLLVALAGVLRGRSGGAEARRATGPWDWGPVVGSTLIYAFAFNLVFIIQELFLVLPKALTPGLHPVLYHNNHNWTGDNPLARLFQGTGALAVLLVGLAALAWSAKTSNRSATLRLLGLWIAFNGLYQSLPQLVAGAILPGNDVGMAMDYLKFGAAARVCAALAGMAALPVAGWAVMRGMTAMAAPRQVATSRASAAYVLRVATLPALVALPLIFLFRAPGTWDQVYLVPVVVSLLGALWMQATAWWPQRAPDGREVLGAPSLWASLGAVAALLAFFQLVLRPGIAF